MLAELGVEVKTVHKVKSFEKKPFLMPYVEFNTDRRKEAQNQLEKDFFFSN